MILAQSLFSEPPALAEPGVIELWLNQRAMLTGIGTIVLGLIVLVGPGQGFKRGWMAGLGIIVLGAAVWGVGEWYRSPLERVRAGADAFYRAVEAGDAAGAEAWLGSEVGVAAAGRTIARDGRGFILAGVERLEGANLTTLDINAKQAEVFTPGTARTQSQLRAVFGGGGPNLVWTALDWRDEGGAWRIRGVDVLLINGKPPGQFLTGAVR